MNPATERPPRLLQDTHIETSVFALAPNDFEQLSLRRKNRIRRQLRRRIICRMRRGKRTPPPKGKVRRGRLLLCWPKYRNRNRYGRIKALAAGLSVSRWTIWRDLAILRAAKLLSRRYEERRRAGKTQTKTSEAATNRTMKQGA